MKRNREEAQRIVQRIDALLDLLVDLIPDCTKISLSLLDAIMGLNRCSSSLSLLYVMLIPGSYFSELTKISDDANKLPRKKAIKRLFLASDEAYKLNLLREELEAAVERFKARNSASTAFELWI